MLNAEHPYAEKHPSHPTVDQLMAFGLGHLNSAEAEALEQHIAVCEACSQVLCTIPDDSLMSALRSGASAMVGGTRGRCPLPNALAEHPRYRVMELLGSGGMGAVYRAEHRLMQRPVALKIIHPHLVNRPAAVERFRREVKAAARLCHPNIVTAYDAEQVGDIHFLVMEFVEGVSLLHLVQKHGPLPISQACAYARQAALGLQRAHEHGMVHRDIKPHNLMRTPEGQVKILDFGLAHFADPKDSEDVARSGDTALDLEPGALTQASTVLGTPDYMAPEQTESGRSKDTRGDIYSLGCTLYYLLTGQPPFPGGTVGQKLAAHRERQPRPLHEGCPGVPTALARIVDRMMAKDPDQRYQTPAEVAQALAPFDGSRRFVAARKWLAPAAAGLLVALAAIVLRFDFAHWLSSRGNQHPGSVSSAVEPTRTSVLPANFAVQVNYPVGMKPYAVAVADFNGDGKQDLAITNIGSNTVSVLLGNGDGTFQKQIGYPGGEEPHGVAASDFNGDGKQDLAVCNYKSSGVSVLLGNGDGTFQPPLSYAAGKGTRGIAVADFNGDGKQDLAVTNQQDSTVTVLLGNGNGAFQTLMHYPVRGAPTSVAIGDFHGQGNRDLVVSNGGSGSVSVLIGNGDGTFRPVAEYLVGSGPGAVVVDDFNGDGFSDIAVENVATNDVSVLLGKGDGIFQPAVSYLAGVGPGGLVTGDFNGDGVLDLGVANHTSSDVSVLLGKGDGSFGLPNHFAAGHMPAGIAKGDFNADGKADLVVVNHKTSDIAVFLNRPAAAHFFLRAPHRIETGLLREIQVVALDAFNRVDMGYTGTVQIVCSDKRAEFSSSEITIVAGELRSWGFGVKFHAAGAYRLLVTDKAHPERVGSVTIVVEARESANPG